MEPFTFIERTGGAPDQHRLFNNVTDLESGKTADHDLQYVKSLREANPEMIVTPIPANNTLLIPFARAGNAVCELDTTTDSYASWKGFISGATRSSPGFLAESVQFAKYHYRWANEDFIVYFVGVGYSAVQYVLKERRGGEQAFGPSAATDALILAVGAWQTSDKEVVWVYDNYWRKDKALYQAVEKATWDKVILDEGIKKDLTSVTQTFFASKQIYEDLGVPWKRGLLFHGPPGNGKTISIKALMHTLLFERGNDPIPTLYVKAAPQSWHIRAVFDQARRQAPCLLILEDLETIVTPATRSYFFNEMDGLENNDGLLVVASTNFLDKLDPGLTKRPSRFDRKYLFPLPNEHERTLYCNFWRRKLEHADDIDFPASLSPAMAHITPGFSFAFLQECFVATLLILARKETPPESRFFGREREDDDGDKDLEKYPLWRVFKQQAKLLRKEIDTDDDAVQGQQQQDLGASSAVDPLSDLLGDLTLPPRDRHEELDYRSLEKRVLELPPSQFKRREINTAAISMVPY